MRNQETWLIGVLFFSLNCSRQSRDSITVFAAASLVGPLQEIAAQYDSAHPGHTTRLNVAASSVLAQQIEEHAPADVFISASPEWSAYLARHGFVDSAAVVVIARNLLVVIADRQIAQPPRQLNDLLRPDNWPIAVGDPSHVPVGKYAQLSLTGAGLWGSIAPHLLPALDADAAVAMVERGEAPVGIAYRNEAVDNPHVSLAFMFPDSLQPDIQYTASAVRHSKNIRSAQAFVDFLASADGQAILQRYHFLPHTYE